jgi:hypothetical protein
VLFQPEATVITNKAKKSPSPGDTIGESMQYQRSRDSLLFYGNGKIMLPNLDKLATSS